jgi:hypothetical protein
MTLGPGAIRPILVQTLWLPAVVLVASAVTVVWTKTPGWLSVGGAIVSAIGARLWAARLFRVKPHKSDEVLPPPVLPREPGARGVQMNPEYLPALGQQSADNLRSYVGVWLAIGGGIIGSAGPFLLGLVWP